MKSVSCHSGLSLCLSGYECVDLGMSQHGWVWGVGMRRRAGVGMSEFKWAWVDMSVWAWVWVDVIAGDYGWVYEWISA